MTFILKGIDNLTSLALATFKRLSQIIDISLSY